MKLLRFVDWDRTQHYDRKKRGSGPWTKLYNQLADYAFTALTDAERGQLLSLQMLCGQMAGNARLTPGTLPFDLVWLKRQIFATEALAIERFLELGFLEVVDLEDDSASGTPEANGVSKRLLAGCLQRGEEKREEESRRDFLVSAANPPAEKPKKRPRRRFKYPEAFEEFWELSSKRGNKRPAHKAWEKLADEERLEAAAAMELDAQTWLDPSWRGEENFIPHVSTWLSSRSWEGERAKPRRHGQRPGQAHPHAEVGAHQSNTGPAEGDTQLGYCEACDDTDAEMAYRSGRWECIACTGQLPPPERPAPEELPWPG